MSTTMVVLLVIGTVAGWLWLLAQIWLLADEVRRLRDELHMRHATSRFRELVNKAGARDGTD